jgi:hypothetical protein
LGRVLFDAKIDDGSATRAIVRYLMEHLPTSSGSTEFFDVGDLPDLSKWIEAELDDDTVSIISANVEGLTALVGLLDDVKLISASGPDFDASVSAQGEPGPPRLIDAVATVYFLADVQAWAHVDWGFDDSPALAPRRYTDVLLKTRLSFRFTDGRITGVSPEADATAFLPTTQFGDIEAVTAELQEAISLVPGLDAQDIDVLEGDERYELTVQGHAPATLILTMTADSEEPTWAIEITEAESSFAIDLTFVYDSAAWVGGSGGFHSYPPYSLLSASDGVSLLNPVWSVPAWIIRKLDWDPEDN